jgi:hypothetical protein
MKNYNLLSSLVLGMVLFGSWGCAKDQTVAEYDNEQAAKQAAQNLPAVATWVGPVTDSDNSTVGMLQLNLQNQSAVETANDNTTTQMTVLGGQAQLTNVPNSETQISQGHFNPDDDNSSNGTLTATIMGKDASGNAQTLLLSATISGNTMTGQVQAGADTPLNFVASKGASPTSQNLVITSKRAQFENQSFFSTLAPVTVAGSACPIFNTDVVDPTCETLGKTCILQTPAKATCGSNIEMAIVEDNPDGEVNFFNVFTDQPTVQVDLNYYVPVPLNVPVPTASALPSNQTITTDDLFVQTHLQFTAVTWDRDSKELKGNGTTVSGGTSRLECSSISSSNGQGWSCNINNGGTDFPSNVVFAPGQLPAGQK